MIYQIDNDEYSEAFPEEQEYINWIRGIELDYLYECEQQAKLVVTNRTNIVLHKDNIEEFSPYGTVNS